MRQCDYIATIILIADNVKSNSMTYECTVQIKQWCDIIYRKGQTIKSVQDS